MRGVYIKIKENVFVIDMLFLSLAFLLVFPFFILTYYNNPSIDDYSFVFLVKKLGFFGAQHNWYTTWTGRYSSMFILSLHPLLFKSLALYKIISAGIIFFTIQAFYRLINLLFKTINFKSKLIFALLFSFAFFSGMPSLVQGIYWEPGSITYQLANILLLNLIINLTRLIARTTNKLSLLDFGTNSLLVIIIGGLNETSMLLTVVLVGFLIGVDFLLRKKINFSLIKLEGIAVLCALAVLLAPGNEGREASFVPENSKDFFFTISSSFTTAWEFILNWITTTHILITSLFFSFLFILSFNKDQELKFKVKWYFPFILAITGYIFIAISISPGYWALGEPAPSRTINVSYWIFSCFWIVTLLSVFQLLIPFLLKIKKRIIYMLATGCIFLLFIVQNDSYNTAVNDIVRGTAYKYNQEFIERDFLMRTCESKTCSIPSFTAFPSSIFNEELPADDSDWWNHVYGLYYNKETVHLIYNEPLVSATYLFNFESEKNTVLSNQNTITNEFAHTTPNSSVLKGVGSYSATFAVALKDLPNKKTNEFIGLKLSANFYSKNPLNNTMLVVSVQDTTTLESILWRSKNVNYTINDTAKWVQTDFKIPLNKKVLREKNKATIYVWNNGDSTNVYLDDFKVIFY